MVYTLLVQPIINGTLRLAGLHSTNKGRVEMFFDGEWGTVCDDGWDDTDASVACRQLGFGSSGRTTKQFKKESGVVLMDNVDCLGNESMLLDCNHKGIGISNCTYSDDAGVICTGQLSGIAI